jgi:CHAT domain-containing protein
MNNPMRSILRAFASCLALAACTVPKADSYYGDKSRLPPLNLGENSQKQACSLKYGHSGAEIHCGKETDPAGRVITSESSDDPAAFLGASSWRREHETKFQCDTPVPAIVSDIPGAALSCSGRQFHDPESVIAVRIDGTLYVADGGKPVENILPRAVGVMARRVAATPAPSDVSGVATVRAVPPEGAATEAEFEWQMANGALENRNGNYAASELAYASAVSILQNMKERRGSEQAIPMGRQALQDSNLGRFKKADGLFVRAEQLATLPDQTDPLAKPMITFMKALHELNRKKPAEALALLEQIDEGFEDYAPADENIDPGADTGGTPPAAERIALQTRRAMQAADRTGTDALYGWMESRRYRAIALTELGRTREAEDVLKDEQKRYAGRDPRMTARYFRTDGMTAVAAKKYNVALSQLDLAVRTFDRRQRGTWPQAETEMLEAAPHDGNGSYADALPSCHAGHQILSKREAGVSPKVLIPCLDALSKFIKQGDQTVLQEMFALSQLAHGGIASQQIARSTARAEAGEKDVNVAEADRDLARATEELEALLLDKEKLIPGSYDAAALSSLDDKIRKARDRRQAASAARMALEPKFIDLVQDSVSAVAVQAALGPDEALSVTVLDDTAGWTLLVRKNEIFAGRVDGGTTKIDALVEKFRKGMELDAQNNPGPFDPGAAFGLYDAVLGPVADGLAPVKALTVATSGSLLSVPFGALLTRPVERTAELPGAFLIQRVVVSHTPSAANFVDLRSRVKIIKANRPWFGMGDFRRPTEVQALKAFPKDKCGNSASILARNLDLLPARDSGLEAARAIWHAGPEDQLLGSAFTVTNIIKQPLSDYRIVHFAAHGVLSGELECQNDPAILTSTAPNAEDALGSFLTAAQISTMHLNAELVILAACNTGGPDGTAAGESLSGLAQAFFRAGARSLLVTHWKANAEAMTRLTKSLLEELESHPGAGPAAALAAWQRQMLATAAGDHAYQMYPYYWAVAALIGGRGADASAAGG